MVCVYISIIDGHVLPKIKLLPILEHA